jgi:hypothetical protein
MLRSWEWLRENDKKTLEGYKKITEHPVKKGNSFLSVFLPGESIKKK